MPKRYPTPMSGHVCHVELCRAFHALHRASQAGTWIFAPLAVDVERTNAEPVYVAYLNERLYLFREGNAYRMAYGVNPMEAYQRAYAQELKASTKPRTVTTKHLWHVSSCSIDMGWWCEYHGYDAKAARAAFDKAKKIYPRATVERDGVAYRRWK